MAGIKQKYNPVKPAIYTYIFRDLKDMAKDAGWNLLLHGSMSRDLDLVLVPWSEDPEEHEALIHTFAVHLGGRFVNQAEDKKKCFPHGRLSYIINLNRGEWTEHDPQYYLDISVFPVNKQTDGRDN